MKRLIGFLLFAVMLPLGSNLFAQEFVRQTREEYIARYHHIAVEHMERYGIPASITLAQGILESDCGNSRLSRSSNNHFGIKCKRDWTGDRVYHDDDAAGECFRAYPSVENSYEDHAEFLDRSPRYDSLFAYPSHDYHSWARGLKAAGYATAPDYAERLVKIIEESRLYLFDRAEGESLYAAAQESPESFVEQSSIDPQPATLEGEGVDPNNYHITINAHEGYNVYRVNGVCYTLASERDSFEQIGKIFRISPRNLRRFNDLKGEVQPLSGEVVFIERKRDSWMGAAATHTTVAGETPYAVAQRYGLRLKSLRRMNRLKSTEEPFREGVQLKLRK